MKGFVVDLIVEVRGRPLSVHWCFLVYITPLRINELIRFIISFTIFSRSILLLWNNVRKIIL